MFIKEKRVYKSYPQSFKGEAVALVTEQGYSVTEAAKSLGIRANQLYDWKAKLAANEEGAVLPAYVIIASFCIDRNLPLLFSDKDFKPFVKHLGLVEA